MCTTNKRISSYEVIRKTSVINHSKLWFCFQQLHWSVVNQKIYSDRYCYTKAKKVSNSGWKHYKRKWHIVITVTSDLPQPIYHSKGHSSSFIILPLIFTAVQPINGLHSWCYMWKLRVEVLQLIDFILLCLVSIS